MNDDQQSPARPAAEGHGAETVAGAASSRRVIKIGSQRERAPAAEGSGSAPSPPPTGEPAEETTAESTIAGGMVEPAAAVPELPPLVFPPPRLDRITPELQDEIDAALGDLSLEDLLRDERTAGPPGDELLTDTRLRATVVKVDRDLVFFSLGLRDEGAAPLRHFAQPPEPGSILEVVIVRFLPEEGLYELAVPGASVDVGDWSDLAEGVLVDARITGHNKGGLECEVNQLRGFIPAGQVSLYRVEDLSRFVGQKLPCVVTEVNPQRRNLVLSHRAVLERERQAARERLLEELQPGQVREGVVSSVRDFGAFVDLGGVEGLVHVSQLSWDRVAHPRDVLEVGQRVKVKVEKIDRASGKIGLSYRDLLEQPWQTAADRFPAGTVVKGTVSKVMDFGAFVRLAPGIEGLVHISELAHQRVQRVSQIVREGQELEVKVLAVDPDAQRLSLSLKAAQAVAGQDEPETGSDDVSATPETSAAAEPNRPLKGGLGRRSGGEPFGLNW